MTSRDRAMLGVLILIATATLTVLRARAVAEPLAALPTVTQMHREGRATDDALSNAAYHAAHAQENYDGRWHLSGYALQGVLGGMIGLALLVWRPKPRAV